MTLNIDLQQNIDNNLQLLAAQRHLYTKAKILRHCRIFVSLGLAITSPFILFFINDFELVMATIGGIWLIISQLILVGIESKKRKQAATIQEEFDTNLFGLPWNQTLVGNKLTAELIHAAARDYTGDRNELRDWYSDTGTTPYPLNVLLCQRSNLVWDWRLRQHYGWIIVSLTFILFIFTIGFAIVTKQTLINYILGFFLPSSSAFLQGIEAAKAHFTTAKAKKNKEKEISAIWESGLMNPNLVSQEQCRRIQDCIFLLRSKGPLIPDWWYKLFRTKYEVDMQSVVAELKIKAESRGRL